MWIAFLEVKPSFVAAFHAAKELGYKVLYITSNKTLVASDVPADRFIRTDFESIDDLINAVRGIDDLRMMWTIKDQLVPLVTEFNATVLNHHESIMQLKASHRAKDKLLLRESMSGTDLNPDYESLNAFQSHSDDFIKGLLKKYDRACVVKPCLGHSSIGVERVLCGADLQLALQKSITVLKALKAEVKGSVSKNISSDYLLIEEYLPEPEYSVEVLVYRGKIIFLGVCSKSKMKEPFFEEISYLYPGQVSNSEHDQLMLAAELVTEKIEFYSGIMHMEFRFKNNQPKLLDVGLRLGGGGLTHTLINYAEGINLVKATLQVQLGVDPEASLISNSENLCLLYLQQVHHGGTVASIPDFQDIHELQESHSFVKKGDVLTGYPEYSGLPGYAIFCIDDRVLDSYKRAEHIVRQCLETEKIIYRDKND